MKSLSLRIKFLIIVGVLLSAAIFSYLVIAVNLFNSDKRAYIYDGNASLSNSLASESNSVILNSIDAIEMIGRIVQTAKNNSSFANRLFEMNENVVYLEVHNANRFFSTRTSNPIYRNAKFSYLEPYNLSQSFYGDTLKNRPVDKKALRQNKYVLYQGSSEQAPLLTVATVTNSKAGQVDDIVTVAHLRKDRLLNIFSRTDLYQTFLANAKGEILIQNKLSQAPGNELQQLASRIAGSDVKASVLTYKKSGEEFILAFSKLDRLGLTVLSEIKSDVAFLASKRLVEKSIQFALLIFFISLVVSIVFTKQLTAALSLLVQGTLKIGEGHFSTKVQVKSGDEIGHLAKSFNIMSEKIVSLLEKEKEKVGLEKELATAQTVQNTFFPEDTITAGPLTVTGRYQPATQCGGDWWGHVEGPDGVQYVFIADAMGHGVSAALVTAMAYSSCQTLAQLIKSGSLIENSPGQILEKFNKVLYDAVEGQISMTFFAMRIDTKKGQITYANAGHNFPILFPVKKDDKRAGRVAKSFQKISDRPPVNLNVKGTPLGVTPNCKFEEDVIDMAASDKFFLFTDGIIECSNPAGDVWGRKTLIKNVLETIEGGAREVQDNIFNRATKFFDGNPLDDDLTIVVVEVDEHYKAEPAMAAS